jgi:hypothetical protein
MLNTQLQDNSLGWLTDAFLGFSTVSNISHTSIDDAVSFIGVSDTIDFLLGGCPYWTESSETDTRCLGVAEEWAWRELELMGYSSPADITIIPVPNSFILFITALTLLIPKLRNKKLA